MRSQGIVATIFRLLGDRALAILTFVFATGTLSHLCGCGFYLCAALHPSNKEETWVWNDSTFDDDKVQPFIERPPNAHWIRSVFFVFTVFTTVGFGSPTPYTPTETAYNVFLMMLGAVVNAIVVSEVMQIISKQNLAEKELKGLRNTIEAYIGKFGISDAMYEEKLKQHAEKYIFDKYCEVGFFFIDHGAMGLIFCVISWYVRKARCVDR